MDASNVFGVGLGEKKFNMILAEFPDILTLEEDNDVLVNLIVGINGFAPNTANKFVINLPTFKHFIKEHPKIKIKLHNNKRKREESNEGNLTNINVVFTGVRDKELETYIIDNGGKVSNSVTKLVTVVIVGDINSNSGKVKKARKNNIPIMIIDDFKQTYIE